MISETLELLHCITRFSEDRPYDPQSNIHTVGKPLRPRQHTVCLVIILEALFDRVPMQSPFGLHRNMVKQASGTGAMTNLRRGGWSLPTPDTFQPVTVLVGALI